MLTKSKVKKTIDGLPDSFSIDELIDRLFLIEKISAGIQQSETGMVITNEDVKAIID